MNKNFLWGVTSTFDVGQTGDVVMVLCVWDWSLQSSSASCDWIPFWRKFFLLRNVGEKAKKLESGNM